MNLVQRVATRHLVATRALIALEGLGRGDTFQNENVRVHRYADLLTVTDLRNAGKRGKTCDQFSAEPTYAFKGNRQEWLGNMSSALLEYKNGSNPYSKMLSTIKDVLVDFPGEIQISETKLKAIEVEPYGVKFEVTIPREDGKSTLEVTSSPIDFSVRDHGWMASAFKGQGAYHDTFYVPNKRQDGIAFYGWMKDNASKVSTFKSIQDFLDLWKKLGVDYRTH